MKTGEDNWCPHCKEWMSFDNNGKCIKCGTHIDTKSKEYSWFDKFGVESKELQGANEW